MTDYILLEGQYTHILIQEDAANPANRIRRCIFLVENKRFYIYNEEGKNIGYWGIADAYKYCKVIPYTEMAVTLYV